MAVIAIMCQPVMDMVLSGPTAHGSGSSDHSRHTKPQVPLLVLPRPLAGGLRSQTGLVGNPSLASACHCLVCQDSGEHEQIHLSGFGGSVAV